MFGKLNETKCKCIMFGKLNYKSHAKINEKIWRNPNNKLRVKIGKKITVRNIAESGMQAV